MQVNFRHGRLDPIEQGINYIRDEAKKHGYNERMLFSVRNKLVGHGLLNDSDFFLAWHGARLLDTPYDLGKAQLKRASSSFAQKLRRRHK